MQIEIRGTKYTPAPFTDRDLMRLVSFASSGVESSIELEKIAASTIRKMFPDAPGLTSGDTLNLHTFELLPIAQQLGEILAQDPSFKGSLPALRKMSADSEFIEAIDQLEAGFGKVTPLQTNREQHRPRKRQQR